jgi:glycosyltransferase 2 family protein
MKKNYTKWMRIIGILLFLYILTRLDFSTALKNLVNFKWEYLIVYAILSILMLLFKSLRWKTILTKQEINYSIKKVCAINAFTSFLGMLTPGRVGELSKVVYLQEDNISFSRSIVSVLIDRLYDIMMLLFIGAIAFFYFANILIENIKSIFIVAAIIIVVCVFIFFFRSNIWELLKKGIKFLLPSAKYELIVREWSLFKSETIRVFPPTIPQMIGYSVLIYCCYYAQINIVAYGFNVYVSFVYLSFCMTLASLVSLLPISIGGLGTREAIFILLLSKVGVSPENALLIAFIDSNIFGLAMSGLLALLSNMFFKKIKK